MKFLKFLSPINYASFVTKISSSILFSGQKAWGCWHWYTVRDKPDGEGI